MCKMPKTMHFRKTHFKYAICNQDILKVSKFILKNVTDSVAFF